MYLFVAVSNVGLLALLNVYHVNLGKPDGVCWHARKGYYVLGFFLFKSRISEDLSANIDPEGNVQDYSYPDCLFCHAVMELSIVM